MNWESNRLFGQNLHLPKKWPRRGTFWAKPLTVGDNQFCVLKLFGAILDVYEAGQYTVYTPENYLYGVTQQLSFSGLPITGLYETLYLNCVKMPVKNSGVTLSCEMVEVDYHVDYSIHIATREDAVKLVNHLSHRTHVLSTQDISSYAESTIVRTLSQLVQITSLGQGYRELQMHLLSQHMQQYLQESLSI